MTRISAMLEDQTGALWMATHGLGLLKLDREHGRFLEYTKRFKAIPIEAETVSCFRNQSVPRYFACFSVELVQMSATRNPERASPIFTAE